MQQTPWVTLKVLHDSTLQVMMEIISALFKITRLERKIFIKRKIDFGSGKRQSPNIFNI